MEKDLMKKAEEIAEETKAETSNGNKEFGTNTAKPGGAQRGGPGLEKAEEVQPPDATVPFRNG